MDGDQFNRLEAVLRDISIGIRMLVAKDKNNHD